jgi:hypothetical protein
LTNEEQWDLFGYCVSVGLTPVQGKMVVLLAESGGMMVDELEFCLFGAMPARYRHRRSSSSMANIKMQLAMIRAKETATGVYLDYSEVERVDALGRAKLWHKHRVIVNRRELPDFMDWRPPGMHIDKKKAA